MGRKKKLNETDIKIMKEMKSKGMTNVEIAKKVGIHFQTVARYVGRRTPGVENKYYVGSKKLREENEKLKKIIGNKEQIIETLLKTKEHYERLLVRYANRYDTLIDMYRIEVTRNDNNNDN